MFYLGKQQALANFIHGFCLQKNFDRLLISSDKWNFLRQMFEAFSLASLKY